MWFLKRKYSVVELADSEHAMLFIVKFEIKVY